MKGFEYDEKQWQTDPKVDRYMKEVHPEVGPEIVVIPARGNTARDGHSGKYTRGRR